MARKILQGMTALLTETVTHEGAAAVDLMMEDPLLNLVFGKGSCLFTKTYYRTQAVEIFAYSKALLHAERHEPGFAWKFAVYMRDPKRGKGNRIQGTVAPAILSAGFPDSPNAEEYVFRCLQHRADDLALFVSHFSNLFLGEIPENAKKGMARAANQMDEYQLLKYSSKQFPLNKRRSNGKRASIRIVDALGIAKAYLDDDKKHLYEYLHAATKDKDKLATRLTLVPARRKFFKETGELSDAEAGRLSVEQILSFKGGTKETWSRILEMKGLLPDIAFKQYLRSMFLSGISEAQLKDEAAKRKYAGLWPHQIYAGYKAIIDAMPRLNHNDEVRYQPKACPELVRVLDVVLAQVAEGLLPPGLNLGIADISGSMFAVPLGGADSSVTVGDAAVLFAGMMSHNLGYSATFDDKIHIMPRKKTESDLQFAARIHKDGKGWGSTQVAGSMASLMITLLNDETMARPRTLYFFSDMQFHPPELQEMPNKSTGTKEIKRFFSPEIPPLLSVINAWRELIGPVDVVLWNMAAYDNAPVSSKVPNVLLLSGFDANTFRHVTKWQEEQASPSAQQASATADNSHLPPGTRDPHTEISFIRTF